MEDNRNIEATPKARRYLDKRWEISRQKTLTPEFKRFLAETKLETPIDAVAYLVPSVGRFLERWVPFLGLDGYKRAQKISPN